MGCSIEDNVPPPGEDVNVDEMLQLLVGIKHRYAVQEGGALYNAFLISGFTTGEIVTRSSGTPDFNALEQGLGRVIPSNSVVTRLWESLMTINKTSTDLMRLSEQLPDRNMGGAIYAMAASYRALSLGTAAAFWEQLPVNTGVNASFVPRDSALSLSVRLLDSASQLLQGIAVPASFYERVGREVDLPNLTRVLSARYLVMLRKYDLARAVANQINNRSSVFFYNIQNVNPVFIFGNTTVGFRGNPLFGLRPPLVPETADKRRAFYLGSSGFLGGFFRSAEEDIPIYLPGEKWLILAECFLKGSSPDLVRTRAYLDSILTKKPAADAYGIGADLAPLPAGLSAAQLETEVYRQRCIELYFSGMRLEDSRRFNRPGPLNNEAERSRNWMPYPRTERDGNVNTPVDPYP